MGRILLKKNPIRVRLFCKSAMSNQGAYNSQTHCICIDKYYMIYIFVVCKYIYIYTHKHIYLRLICLRIYGVPICVRAYICVYMHTLQICVSYVTPYMHRQIMYDVCVCKRVYIHIYMYTHIYVQGGEDS